jgi:hypothetical protein
MSKFYIKPLRHWNDTIDGANSYVANGVSPKAVDSALFSLSRPVTLCVSTLDRRHQ